MKKMFVFAKGCVLGLALMLCGQGAFADSLGMGQGLGETAFNITRAVENQPCAPLRNGDIGMSADGLILSCQSSRWKKTSVASFNGLFIRKHFGGGCVRSNPITGGCSCPSGSSAQNFWHNLSGNSGEWETIYMCR